MNAGPELRLDIYGLRVGVAGGWDDVVADVRSDFAWFEAPGDGHVDLLIEVERRPPDYAPFDGLSASFVTPRNVVFQNGASTVVDYFGRALLILTRDRARARVEGEDPGVVREAVGNLVISRVGEHLNARGLVRLHALGLSGPAGAVAVVMPSGGGKSTLALRALADERFRILSEDSPLIDRNGLAHPFPLRIGINPTDAALVPESYSTRLVERLEFHPKLVLDVAQFRERIERVPRPLRHLVIGRRTLGEVARLEPLPRRRATGALLREAVVGVGVYQGMEFVLQKGWGDVLGKSGTAARRARVTGSVLRRATVWQLSLGRDRESNWEALLPLLTDPI